MNGWAEILTSFLGISPPRRCIWGRLGASKNRKKWPDARRSRTTRAEPSQTGRASALVWPNQSYEKFVAKTRVRTLHTGGNFSGRIQDVKYGARMDLTAKMIPGMIQTVGKVHRHGCERGPHCSARRDFVAVGISGNDRRTLSESSIVVRD